MEKKKLNPQQALQKIYRFCAYQERAHQEVRSKLYEMGLWRDEVEGIISQLITENFLNEERFAKAFAGGKFRMKKWGKLRITRELEMRGLTSRCIKVGLNEIDDQAYHRTLENLILSKQAALSEPDIFIKRDKVAQYAIGKGYEPDLVWGIVKRVMVE